jgi:GAF domain-containing protein
VERLDDLDVVGFQEVVDELLAATGASRCTLRLDVPDEYFPVTHEALAPGVSSIREERTTDLRKAPVVRQMVETGAQVVQDDCSSAFDDSAFQRMLGVYGGLAAQIVTPVFLEGKLAAIVSLHQLGAPRRWSDEERALAAAAGGRVQALLSA